MQSKTVNREPPWSLEERLKHILLPASLYMRYRTRKELQRGEVETKLLPLLADPSRISLDIGANKGVYTWLLRNCSRQVHAFEPNPKMFRMLRRLAGRNIHVSPIALSNRSGSDILRIPGNRRGEYSNQHASLSPVNITDDYFEVEVKTSRLDDMQLTDIGFIKIDVEGFEQAVLEGAEQTIRRDKPVLLIELEQRHTLQPIEDSIARVEALGYRGLFINRGILKSIDRFDADRHHRDAVHNDDYVFNFIFLPKE